MIDRYAVSEITRIWSDQNKFETFLKVEIALLEALEKYKRIPSGTHLLFHKTQVDTDRIKEIEEKTRHDVIAFCTSITEQVKDDRNKFFHFGVTSSDIIDTALSLQIKESLNIILLDMSSLLETLLKKAENLSECIGPGRSHGIFAEPMSYGQKFLSFFHELQRRYKDLQSLSEEITGQYSGAVGNYTVLSPDIEKLALDKLGLKPDPASSQVIPRDYLAKCLSIGALTASCLERISVELRLLQHSDISEVFEGFSAGQKGSSTMPHKKNPISAENISGLARIIKSHINVGLENNVLWHERDISHSSAERMILPDHFGLLTYTLRRMDNLILNLDVDKNSIQQKAQNNPKMFSSYFLHTIIEGSDKSRDSIYTDVQKIMFESSSLDSMRVKLEEIYPNVKFSQDILTVLSKKYKTIIMGKINSARNSL